MDPEIRRFLQQRLILVLILFFAATLFMWADSRKQRIIPVYHGQDLPFVQGAPGEAGPNIIGINDIIFTPPAEIPSTPLPQTLHTEPIATDRQRLFDFDYLIRNFYTVNRTPAGQPTTALLPSDIDVYAFINADLSIDNTIPGPKILIFHTHSTEMFIDSNPSDPMSGIMGVGRYLAEILAVYYGIETMHHTGRFDMVDNRPRLQGSYERMEPVIRQILADNPSIQMVIDLHRDGFPDGSPPLIHYINGVRTAQLMFFNGMTRQYRNGQISAISGLHNPYLQENLMLSFQMQMHATELFPGLMRRIFLREFRFSLHMLPLSTLVEVGNQFNTQEEAKNAMYPLARVIAEVVLR